MGTHILMEHISIKKITYRHINIANKGKDIPVTGRGGP
jgi:hypothetical protein